jgi:hypothetical protein
MGGPANRTLVLVKPFAHQERFSAMFLLLIVGYQSSTSKQLQFFGFNICNYMGANPF